jgi:tetratricopeptide (TPR) repeat protein
MRELDHGQRKCPRGSHRRYKPARISPWQNPRITIARRLQLPAICACALAVLASIHAAPVTASVPTEAARQLIESTSLLNILRTDAEQASLIIDQLPEEVPADLRSDLRRVIDQNLGSGEMEDALVKSLAIKLDSSTLDGHLRWWASESGRAISKAESSAYTSMFAESSFEALNSVPAKSFAPNLAAVSQAMDNGQFARFVAELLGATGAARRCLESTFDDPCPPRSASINAAGADEMSSNIVERMREGLSRVSSGDLQAYVAYLRTDNTTPTNADLRAALLSIEQRSWEKALVDESAVIDRYARAKYGSSTKETFGQLVADIDGSRHLSRDHLTLELMRRAGPPDPAVLVQLARVVLKQAPNLTDEDFPPSVPRIDAASLEDAQRLLDQALALDTHRAETLMMSGHVAYLKTDFKRSFELLQQAKAIGIGSPWLRIYLGDTLWALGRPLTPDRALVQQAADEFEAALKDNLPSAAKQRAVHQLGSIYEALGDVPKADEYQRRFISMQQGRNKGSALHRYALFLFVTGNVDAAIIAGRQAVQARDPDVGPFLAQLLTTKGGILHAAGRSREAAPYFAEARTFVPDLESLCPALARSPVMLPGVFGLHAEGLLGNFSGSIGGQTLAHASAYAKAAEIDQLLAWGASPNYFDSEEGTPLHAAILAGNVAAVKTLLEHGANPLTLFRDGRTPSEMAKYPQDSKRAEIRGLLTKATGRTSPTGPVGTPLKVGYKYRLKKPVHGDQWGNSFAADEQLIFTGTCQYTDSSIACLLLKSPTQPKIRDLAIAKDELVGWSNWFEELGPAE